MPHELLKIGPRITCLPVIHGSGDFALEVRRVMLEHAFDCVAVPLPPSFQARVEEAIQRLPTPLLVTQPEPPTFATSWRDDDDESRDESDESEGDEGDEAYEPDDEPTHSYVPVDPCQGVIMALRIALGEHLPRAFIDLETARFRPHSAVLPDPYALKRVPLARFAAAIVPSLKEPPAGQPRDRAAHMAMRLRELEGRHASILFVCSILDWPWIRDAYMREVSPQAADDFVEEPRIHQPDPKTLIFLLGELPFITDLYERARAELEDDQNLSVDGVKELLMAARDRYRGELKGRARKIPPKTLSLCLKYIRNLSLLESRLTPDLYTIVTAAKQVAGDRYALHVAETARAYPRAETTEYPRATLGIGRARLDDGSVARLVSRLPGPPVVWRSLQLQRRPEELERRKWRMQWNPFSHCSWPPEDERIEQFRSHVFDRARQILGMDLVRTEKFTTSIRDGIDIRDTMRNWHTGELYVKVLPPAQGRLDCVVMLFDAPADPRHYPWRITWYAEHDEESTLAFFATDYRRELVGPGIALATYGGAMFLYPPVSIRDIWQDRRLDFTETLEERLLAAACLHSQSPRIALLSSLPPGAGWRRLAKRFGKSFVHVPLSGFSDSTVQQLRIVHVLNGRQVRGYAQHFIREA
jgi:hypothetical protein